MNERYVDILFLVLTPVKSNCGNENLTVEIEEEEKTKSG
jgi:hypothetical protein